MKTTIECPSCRQWYTVNIPNASGTYTVCCPNCLAPYSVTAAQPTHTASSAAAAVAANVRHAELAVNIAWIVIGVMQIVSRNVSCIGVSIWNIVNSVRFLTSIKNIQPRNAGIVPYYENKTVLLIVWGIINVAFGGYIGILLIGAEWFIRGYVLKHRAVFTG